MQNIRPKYFLSYDSSIQKNLFSDPFFKSWFAISKSFRNLTN